MTNPARQSKAAYKGENLAPNEADKLITELRAQGFKARAVSINAGR